MMIPVTPVPASRPRVPRRGKPYYVGRYKQFREDMNEWLSDAILPEPVAVPVQCEVEFVCKKPKAPVNTFPVGDIDNYLKAVWDSLQGRGFFKDDKQIEDVIASKRYVNPGETPHIQIEFKES